MKFGVVQCSRCKRAIGVRAESKTAACPQCGKRMVLKRVKILCGVDSEKELAKTVMQLNIRFKDGEEIVEEDMRIIEGKKGERGEFRIRIPQDVYEKIVSRISSNKGEEKIVAIARELCRLLGEFTEEDLKEVLKRTDIWEDEACESYLVRLKEHGVIYEPKSGIYRCPEK